MFERLEKTIAGAGRFVAWLTLAMVAVTFGVVVLRYGFSLGWIWLQEVVTYLHAAVFMLAAAWTLQDDGHVRVDVFYRTLTARGRAWVDLGGIGLLLLPLCLFLIVVGFDYVGRAWQVMEGSREAGGLPAVYLLKSLILLLPILLLGQALCTARRAVLALRAHGAEATAR